MDNTIIPGCRNSSIDSDDSIKNEEVNISPRKRSITEAGTSPEYLYSRVSGRTIMKPTRYRDVYERAAKSSGIDYSQFCVSPKKSNIKVDRCSNNGTPRKRYFTFDENLSELDEESVNCPSPFKSKRSKTRTRTSNVRTNNSVKKKAENEESDLVSNGINETIEMNNSDESFSPDLYKTPKRKYVRKNLLNTPNSGKIMRSVKKTGLTPSVVDRVMPVQKPATPLQKARSTLHVSALPKSLPCREAEFNDIFTFLRGKLYDKSSGCIYISGVPGTGKTATVNETVRGLRKLVDRGEIMDFDLVSINGMKLSEPRQAYVQILKQLNNKTFPWEQAQEILSKRFKTKSKDRNMTLLLVDELDLLCTRRQDVVYNLLDWPTNEAARLVVVTIANTMDLPEKVFLKRVNSRLGMTRLTFEPYNYKQLQQIVVTRLKTSGTFEDDAVEIIARKVASQTGDARRALDICRRATEITELNGREVVSMEDVNMAFAEMMANPKIQAIKHCSKFEKMFLQAVVAEILRTGREETTLDRVYDKFDMICRMEGKKVNVTLAMGVCARLGSSGLLVTEHSRADIFQKILLNVALDDVQFAVRKNLQNS